MVGGVIQWLYFALSTDLDISNHTATDFSLLIVPHVSLTGKLHILSYKKKKRTYYFYCFVKLLSQHIRY